MSALKGLKVVEMSAIGPVPLAGMLMADMGADVVVLDKANDPLVVPDDIMRRGKRAVEINLKSAEGVAYAKQLIESADIVLEGFRPGVMERLGLGPDEFLRSNPRLIFGRMTGWGQDGPLSTAAAHDINYIAITGALYAMGRPDSPPAPPLNLVGDYGGGTMFLVMGVLAALHERHSSGKGQVVDAAITEGTAVLMTILHTLKNIGQWSPERGSNLLDSGAHFYDCYETADGKYVSLGSIEPHFYQLLKEKLSLSDELFGDQYNPLKWPQQKRALAEKFKSKTRDQWTTLLEGSDVCFAPVLDADEAVQHHHMVARNAYTGAEGQEQPAPAPRLSRTPSVAGETLSQKSDIGSILEGWADQLN